MERPRPDMDPRSAPRKLKDKLLYPDTDFYKKVSLPSMSAGLMVELGSSVPIRPIGLLAGAIIATPSLLETAIRRHRAISITDRIKLVQVKTEHGKEVDGYMVVPGSLIGELHFSDKKNKKWRKLSSIQRGMAVQKEMIEGLLELGVWCGFKDSRIQEIDVFHATSHIIKPFFLKRVGLESEKKAAGWGDKTLLKIARARNLGVRSWNNPLGNVNEVWFTRRQLIDAIPKLAEMQKQLSK